jgi:hypothetical protein
VQALYEQLHHVFCKLSSHQSIYGYLTQQVNVLAHAGGRMGAAHFVVVLDGPHAISCDLA